MQDEASETCVDGETNDVDEIDDAAIVDIGEETYNERAAADDAGGYDENDETRPARKGSHEDGLLNHDLLHELGGANLTPRGGSRTPSEPSSPAIKPWVKPSSMDPWDWRTDAPEFVPGQAGPQLQAGGGAPCMTTAAGPNIWAVAASPASPSGAGPSGSPTWGTMIPVVIGAPPSPTGASSVMMPGAMPMMGPGGVTVATAASGPQAGGMNPAMQPAVGMQPAQTSTSSPTASAEHEARRIKAHYEWQVQRQDDQLRSLQQRLGKLEQRRVEVKDRWQSERKNLCHDISKYIAVMTRYAIPLDDTGEGAAVPQDASQLVGNWGGGNAMGDGSWKGSPVDGMQGGCGGSPVMACGSGPGRPSSGDGQDLLDSKMRRLNGLITEGAQQAQQKAQAARAAMGNDYGGGSGSSARGIDEEACGPPVVSGSIASTLKAMFPHATVRTMAAEAEAAAAVAKAEEQNEQHRKGSDYSCNSGKGARRDRDRDLEEERSEQRASGREDNDDEGRGESLRLHGAPKVSDASDGPRERKPSAADEVSNVAHLPPGEAGAMAAELQRTTKSQIDDRALRALCGLADNDALEVVRRVDDLVKAQGGKCRNLSSILQSVCRKLERRSARGGAEDITPAPEKDPDPDLAATASSSSVARPRKDTGDSAGGGSSSKAEADGSDGEDGESDDGQQAGRKKRNRTRRRRGNRGEDEDDGGGDGAEGSVATADGPQRTEWEEPDAEERLSAAEVAARREEARTARREARLADRRERRRRSRGEASDDDDDADDVEEDEQDDDDEGEAFGGGRRERHKRPQRELPPPPPPPPPPGPLLASSAMARETPAADDDEDASKKEARDYWTTRRVERTAQRGFEVRRRGERWELKLAMGGLDPPLTESGMEKYCKWLRQRLQGFREEHGAQALRRCCGELDFSNNGLGNQAVWMLLEALAQFEVQASSLKLFKNHISQGGVLAICEFIRTNKRAGAMHEMHLSHNEIDDESAHELLRTLYEQKSRYPPRRPVEGAEGGAALVPVWVRLNQNRIRDPPGVLRTLEAEGVTYCSARNAHGCGPGRCTKPECPLVHLYLFADQAPRRRDGQEESNGEMDDYEADRARDRQLAASSGGVATSAAAAAADEGDAVASGAGEGGAGSRRKRGRRNRNRAASGEGGDDGGEDCAEDGSKAES